MERQQGLQAYLDAVLREPPLASTVEVKRFLDPHNYSVNFYGKTLQTFGVRFVYHSDTTGAWGWPRIRVERGNEPRYEASMGAIFC